MKPIMTYDTVLISLVSLMADLWPSQELLIFPSKQLCVRVQVFNFRVRPANANSQVLASKMPSGTDAMLN